MKNLAKKLWANDLVNRAVHTFIQAFVAVFIVGVTQIINTPNLSDAKTALVALVTAAIAAGISAVKTVIVNTNALPIEK